MDVSKPEVKAEDQKVSELTVGELRKLIRTMLAEEMKPLWAHVFELEEQLPDPDENKTFNAEFMAGLEEERNTPAEQRKLYTSEEVKRELGLDE